MDDDFANILLEFILYWIFIIILMQAPIATTEGVKEALTQGKLQKAIGLFKVLAERENETALLDQLIIIEARYNRHSYRVKMGLSTSDTEETDLTYSLLQLLRVYRRRTTTARNPNPRQAVPSQLPAVLKWGSLVLLLLSVALQGGVLSIVAALSVLLFAGLFYQEKSDLWTSLALMLIIVGLVWAGYAAPANASESAFDIAINDSQDKIKLGIGTDSLVIILAIIHLGTNFWYHRMNKL